MLYQTIFEIGPIFHYVQNSRKTMDVWGGSFLFSYIMGRIVLNILELEDNSKTINEVIKRPYLKENPLFNWIDQNKVPKDGIAAGTIPDQIFCLHEKADLPRDISDSLSDIIYEIFRNSKDALNTKLGSKFSNYSVGVNTIKQQLTDYFRLFWVSKKVGIYENNWDDLLKAIAARGRIFKFDSFENAVNNAHAKKEKCTLCGDYKRIITLKGTRRNGNNEHLCAVCTIKRGLLLHLQSSLKLNRFLSTTAIAATTVQEILKKNYSELEKEINEFVKKYLEKGEKGENQKREIVDEELVEIEGNNINELLINYQSTNIIPHLPYQIYFGDYEFSKIFRNRIKEKFPTNEPGKVWIDHGYYAIVSMDGDNTGRLFNSLNNKDDVKKLSADIADYSAQAPKTLSDYGGQLIYSGGEDTLFIIHPKFILQAVQKFSNIFNEKIDKYTTGSNKAAISAGAFICPHKHPLKLALKGAEEMLEKAKAIPGKNALAIKLVKGVGEVNVTWLKIQEENISYTLTDFEKLIENYSDKSISRGFVYKLVNDFDVFNELIEEPLSLLKYVQDTFKKTRQEEIDFTPEMKRLVERSFYKNDERKTYQPLIDRLYLARFLTGGE